MIKAAIAVMALRLRRDIPSLLLVFALPPLVFFVFTAVFREASTRMPQIAVAIFDGANTETSTRIAASLKNGGDMQVRREPSEQEVRTRVAASAADVGVLVRSGAGGDAHPELVVLKSHAAMARLVASHLTATGTATNLAGAPAVTVVPTLHGDPVVLEEIGAVAAMFLLISAIQVAATLVDERRSGIHERIASCGDVAGLVIGKLVFGIVIGTLQAGLIVATAAVAFDADVSSHPVRLVLAGVLTAALATSLTLLIAACCSTRHQAQTISTFAILISSAVGGSMVPAKLMPDSLSWIGRWTPNAWSIQAFSDAFDLERDPSRSMLQPWIAMSAASIIVGWLAVIAFRRPPVL